MTEEDLRNLGINPAAMNAAYYPQSQSVTSADLAILGAGNPKNVDAAYLNGSMPAPAQPTPQDLSASQYPSDPNGLVQQESVSPDQVGQQIAPQPSAQADTNGNPVMTGSVPEQEQPQQSSQQSPKDQKLFWDWYKTTFQVRKGDMVDSKHVNAMQLAFANATLKAKETPPPQIINANGHHYLQVGNTVLDAEPKADRFHQVQLADGTLGQVDRESNTFTPFKDGSGQIVKGKSSGIDVNGVVMQGLQQQAAELASKVASNPDAKPMFGDSYATQLRSVQAKMAALQNPQQIAPPTTQPAPTAIPAATPQQAQAPAMDPVSIRSAYKSGQIDKATAVSLLRQHGFQ